MRLVILTAVLVFAASVLSACGPMKKDDSGGAQTQSVPPPEKVRRLIYSVSGGYRPENSIVFDQVSFTSFDHLNRRVTYEIYYPGQAISYPTFTPQTSPPLRHVLCQGELAGSDFDLLISNISKLSIAVSPPVLMVDGGNSFVSITDMEFREIFLPTKGSENFGNQLSFFGADGLAQQVWAMVNSICPPGT